MAESEGAVFQREYQGLKMKPYYEHEGITIYHGDCREVLPTLPAKSINLFLTDPPYGLAFNQDDLGSRRELAMGRPPPPGSPPARPIDGDKPEEWEGLIDGWLQEAPRLAHPQSCCCCCAGGGGPEPVFARFALKLDVPPLEFVQALVWDKGGIGTGWRYRRSYELVMVAKFRGRPMPWYDDTNEVSNVLRVPKIIPQADDHPTVKPVGLMERLILLHTQPGDLVLDPFMGSGTTLRAAANLGRRCIGIETEEHWCQVAIERLRQGVLL